VIAGSPLDVARVRLQQAHSPHRSLSTALPALIQSEGVTALFKGLSYPLCTVTLQSAVVFQAHGFWCRLLLKSRVLACPCFALLLLEIVWCHACMCFVVVMAFHIACAGALCCHER
jgi:hypothetical protein